MMEAFDEEDLNVLENSHDTLIIESHDRTSSRRIDVSNNQNIEYEELGTHSLTSGVPIKAPLSSSPSPPSISSYATNHTINEKWDSSEYDHDRDSVVTSSNNSLLNHLRNESIDLTKTSGSDEKTYSDTLESKVPWWIKEPILTTSHNNESDIQNDDVFDEDENEEGKSLNSYPTNDDKENFNKPMISLPHQYQINNITQRRQRNISAYKNNNSIDVIETGRKIRSSTLGDHYDFLKEKNNGTTKTPYDDILLHLNNDTNAKLKRTFEEEQVNEDEDNEEEDDEEEDEFVRGNNDGVDINMNDDSSYIASNKITNRHLPAHYRDIVFPIKGSTDSSILPGSSSLQKEVQELKAHNHAKDQNKHLLYQKIYQNFEDKMQAAAVEVMLQDQYPHQALGGSSPDMNFGETKWLENNAVSRLWNHFDYSTLQLQKEFTSFPKIKKKHEYFEESKIDDYIDIHHAQSKGDGNDHVDVVEEEKWMEKIEIDEDKVPDEALNDKQMEEGSIHSKTRNEKSSIKVTPLAGDVIDFRKGMELCLASFVTVFHHLENIEEETDTISKLKNNDTSPLKVNDDDERTFGDIDENLEYDFEQLNSENANNDTIKKKSDSIKSNDIVQKTVNSIDENDDTNIPHPYVPLPIALMLWTEVLLGHLKRTSLTKISSDETIRSSRREAQTLAYKIAMALLSPKVDVFKIRHTGGKQNVVSNGFDLKESSQQVFLHSNSVMQQIEEEEKYNEDESEIEICFHNMNQLHYAWFYHPILRARLNQSVVTSNLSASKRNDTEELLLLKDSSGILSAEEEEAKHWIAMFAKNVLKNLIDDVAKKRKESLERGVTAQESKVEEEDDNNMKSEIEKSLSYLYAIRYYPTFLLHAGSVKPPTSMFSSKNSAETFCRFLQTSPKIKDACIIMKDQNFITDRIENLGLLEGSMVHLDDCQLMMEIALSAKHSISEEVRKVDSFDEFVKIHHAISLSIEKYMTAQNVSIDEKKFLISRRYRHNKNEILKWDETECLVKMTSNIEAGRALHVLGVSLGKHQSTLPSLSQSHEKFIEMEMAMYPKALDSFKESLRWLFSNKLGYGLLPKPPPESDQKYIESYRANMDNQKIAIKHEIEKEIEMNIADTLSCLSYCKDSKASQFDEAIRTYEEALTIYKKHYGEEHPTVSNTLHNMGTICIELKKFNEAINYYQECVQITYKQKNKMQEHFQSNDNSLKLNFAREDEELSKTLQCMGKAHKLLFDYESALKCYTEAHVITLSIEGKKDHVLTADILTELTSIYLEQVLSDQQMFAKVGDKAMEYVKESLRIRNLFNKEDLSKNESYYRNKVANAHDLYTKACFNFWKGEMDEAMKSLEEAMEIRNDFQTQLNKKQDENMAHVFQNQNDSIASVRMLMGKINSNQGNHDAALNCFEELMFLGKERLESEIQNKSKNRDRFKVIFVEIDIGHTLMNIGDAHHFKCDYKKAIEKFKASLRILDDAVTTASKVMESDENRTRIKETENKISAMIASVYCMLGQSYMKLEKFEKAMKCFGDTLKIRYALNHNFHIDVCIALRHLGTILSLKGKEHDAIIHFERSIIAGEKLGSQAQRIHDDPFSLSKEPDMDKYLMECYNSLYQLLSPSETHEEKDSSTLQRLRDLGTTDSKGGKGLNETLFNAGEIAFKLGDSYLKQKLYSKALEFYIAALEEMERKFGKNHVRLSELYFNKANAYKSVQENNKAIECYQKSIQIFQSSKSTENKIFLAEVYHNLGDIYVTTSKNNDAMRSYKEAYSIRKKELGKTHIDTAESLHQIGLIHLDWLKDENSALLCVSDAFSIRKTNLIPDHPKLADSLHVLGTIHSLKGESQISKDCFREELRIRKVERSKDNKNDNSKKLAECLNSLGEVSYTEKKFKKAREYFEEALKINRDQFGNNNEIFAEGLNNVGKVLNELNETKKAMNYLQNALKITSSVDPDHIVASSINFHLALIYSKQHNFDNAMECYIKSLRIYKRYYGKDHEFIINLMHNMGSIFFEAKSFDKALKCYGQALDSCFKLLGDSHEKTGELSKSMGDVLAALKDHDAALDHYHNAASVIEIHLQKSNPLNSQMQGKFLKILLEIKNLTMKTVGPDHAEMANILSQLGNQYASNREYEEAMHCFKEVLRIHKLTLGNDDIALATDLHNIGSIYFEEADNEKALKYFEECIRITKSKIGPDTHVLSDTLRCVGNVKKRQHNYISAVESLKEALRLHRLYLRSNDKKDDINVANLLHDLGHANELLGNLDLAFTLYEEVLQLERKILSDDHPEIAKVLCSIGNIHRSRAENEKAMKCYNIALRIRKKDRQPDTLPVAKLIYSIGVVYDTSGELDEAIKCYHNVLRVYTMILGPDHIDTAKVLGDIGSTLDTMGQSARAMKYLKASLSVLIQKKGKNSVDVADTLHNIGVVYDKKGYIKKALNHYQESLQIYDYLLPEDHFSFTKPLHNLGVICAKLGMYDQSIESLRKSIRLKTLRYGSKHIEVADSQFYLGNVFCEVNRLEDALKELNQSLSSRVLQYGKNASNVADTLFSIGVTHSIRDDNQMALHCFVECLRIRRDHYSSNKMKVIEVQLYLGKVLHELGDLDAAESCLKDVLPIIKAHPGKNHGLIADVSFALGIILCDNGNFSSSITHFNDALKALKNSNGNNTIEVANILENIGIAFKEMRQYKNAIKEFEMALNMKKGILGNNHEEIGAILYFLGTSLLMDGQYDDSIHMLKKSIFIRKLNPKNAQLEMSNNLEGLGKAYEKKEEFQKALACYEEAYDLKKLVGGKNGWDSAVTLQSKGHLYLAKNETANALNSFKEAIQTMERVLGVKQVSSGGSKADLIEYDSRILQLQSCYQDILRLLKVSSKEDQLYAADILLMNGNLNAKKREFEEAKQSYTEAIILFKKYFPSDSLNIANVYHNQAAVCNNSADYREAKRLYQKALTISKAKLGETNLDVADTLYSIGNVCCKISEYEEAKNYLEKALTIRKEILGNDNIFVARAQHSLCLVLYKTEEIDKATKLTEETLLLKRSKVGPDNLSTISTIQLLGNIHVTKRDYKRAMPCFEEVLRVKTLLLGYDHIDVAETLLQIAVIEEMEDNFDRSIQTYRQAQQLYEKNLIGLVSEKSIFQTEMQQNEEPEQEISEEFFSKSLLDYQHQNKYRNPMEVAKTIFDLGSIYIKLEKTKKAKLCFEVALRQYGDSVQENKIDLANTKSQLGLCHMKQRHFQQALSYFNDALQIVQLELGPDHEMVERVFHHLGNIHLEIGANDKALLYYENAMVAKSNRKQKEKILKNDVPEIIRNGIIHKEKAEFKEAIENFEEALQIQTVRLNKNHPDIANILRHLGDTHREIGDYDKSQWHLKKALKIYLSYGQDTVDVAHSLLSMGILQCENAYFDEATECFQRSLEIFKKSKMPNDFILIGRTLNNIGIVHDELQNFDKALDFFSQTLETLRSKIGDHHEEVCYTLHCMGNTLIKKKDFDEAIKFLQRALNGEQDRLGNNSLKVADTLDDMRVALEGKGDRERAIECLKRVLQIRKSKLGYDHKDVADTLFSIGKLLVVIDKSEQALTYFSECLDIMELKYDRTELDSSENKRFIDCYEVTISLMKSNPLIEKIEVANKLFKRGNILAAQKQNDDALQSYFEALQIQQNVLEDNDINIANTMHNIANVLAQKNDMSRAIKFYAKALDITKISLGDDHVLVGDTLHNVGNAYNLIGQHTHALNCFKLALTMRKKYYGENHEFVAATLYGYGTALDKCKFFSKAAQSFRECLRIRRQKYGSNTLIVATTLFDLGNVHNSQHEYIQALNCYEEALIVQQRLLGGDDILIANTLMRLGDVHDHRSDYEKAMICYNAALHIFKHKKEEDRNTTLSIASARFKIGGILRDQQKYNEAKHYYLDVCEIRKKELGEKHKDYADAICELGNVYDKLSESDKSMEFFELARNIYDINAEKHDLNLAKVNHLIGVFYFNKKDYEKSMEYLNSALESRVARLGQNHESVADTIFIMGNIFYSWRDTQKAFKCFDSTHTVYKKKDGISNILVSNSLFRMGLIHEQNDRHDKAIKCYTKSLIGRRQNLGDNHIEVADVLNRLGKIHLLRKQDEKASVCFEECLRIRRLIHGEEDTIEVAQLSLNLGSVFESKQQFRQAKNYYEEALAVLRAKHETNYIHLAKALSLLAGMHVEFQDDDNAIMCYEECLTMYSEHILPDKKGNSKIDLQDELNDHHKEYADAFYNLGFSFFRKGDFNLALRQYNQSLKIYSNALGKEDLNVAKTMYSIALVHSKQRHFNKAMVFFEDALRIRMIYRENANIEVDVADTYLGIALVHEKKREYLEALVNLEECLSVRTSAFGENSVEVAQVLSNMGIIQGNIHEYKTALKNWADALSIYRKLGVSDDDENVANMLRNIKIAEKLC